MANSFSVQMKEILEECSEDVKEASRKGTKKSAQETARTLKSSSRRKTGEYAAGWTSKQLDSDAYVTYNSKMPGLTHLLENGHAIVNKKGRFGRVAGDGKIAAAAKEGEALLVETIERYLP